MNTKQFPVQFSVLSAIALQEQILSKYPIKKPLKCHFYTQGVNDIYIVYSSINKYFLRVSTTNWRTKEEIEAEVMLLNYLDENDIPVVTPVKDNNGQCIQEILAPEGIRYAVLFTEAKGKYKDNLSKSQNKNLGNIIARFHTYTDYIEADIKRFQLDLSYLVDIPLKIAKPYFKNFKKDYETMVGVGNQLKEYINKNLTMSKPEFGICHGDLHRGNIHINSHDNSITLFDFDCFGYGWRSYDISVYLWNHQSDQPVPKDCDSKQKQWDDFLSGYNEIRPLSTNEIKGTSAFVAIRSIWLLGVQLESLNRNQGCDWLDDKYFDYQIDFIEKWAKLI